MVTFLSGQTIFLNSDFTSAANSFARVSEKDFAAGWSVATALFLEERSLFFAAI
jgi:hypothetical protein